MSYCNEYVLGYMLINIHTIPNAKKKEVIMLGKDLYKVKLISPPEKGKANEELIEVLADYFNTKKSNIRIIKGEFGRDKVVEIENR
ncbi:MAG: DUF167 domain-containing protein [candidate division WOR-3 bacterium]